MGVSQFSQTKYISFSELSVIGILSLATAFMPLDKLIFIVGFGHKHLSIRAKALVLYPFLP